MVRLTPCGGRFKFALDFGLYGSDYAAMKVAGHELMGCVLYFGCQIPNLRVPMMAVEALPLHID